MMSEKATKKNTKNSNNTHMSPEHDFMSSVPAIRSDNTERSATFSILNLYESILNVL